MKPTPAPACRKALADATLRWPNRNKASDGIMGDAAHATRKSDHNLGNAFDLTHDPRNGVDCAALTQSVTEDSRVTYVIFAGMIFKRYKPELGWRKYAGPNAHFKHMHVSIKPESRNDLSPWPWSLEANTRPVLKRGDRGEDVKLLQTKLRKYLDVSIDGHFGPNTERLLKIFQRQEGLAADGVAGIRVWEKLG